MIFALFAEKFDVKKLFASFIVYIDFGVFRENYIITFSLKENEKRF